MARVPRTSRRSRQQRHGLLDSLIDDATEIVQSVANEVAPGIVGAIDVDEIVQRVDIQAILDKVDVQALMDRVDVGQLLERVDLNQLLERVDIDALVARTELGNLMARSSSAMVSRGLDAVRSQGVGLDGFVHRWADRLLRRDAVRRPRRPRVSVPTRDVPA